MHLRHRKQQFLAEFGKLILLAMWVLPCASPTAATAQTQPPSTAPSKSAHGTGASSSKTQSSDAATGSIEGTVVDQEGAVAVGAKVQLSRPGQAARQEVLSGDDGQFSFINLPPGEFGLTVSASGFQTKVVSGAVTAGQAYIVPEIVLNVAPTTTDVQVAVSPVEVAEEQIKEQEQQRVLGIFPNFYVSYVHDAVPLIPRQKFQLAWKSATDPVTVLGAAFIAGMYQAADEFPGYGQGAEGYGKRLGAAYADVFVGTFLGSAAFPSLLKQDPRYFYKGTGSTRSRIGYALANAVMCRGDNGKYEVNYAGILGAFASAGISYTYYPASDRDATLVVQNALVRLAEGSVAGIFQEFVFKKFTTRGKKQAASTQP